MKLLNTRKKTLIISLGVLVTVVLVAGYVKHRHYQNSKPQIATTSSGSKVNYGPPTDAEKAESAAADKAARDHQSSPPPSSGSKSTISPVIVNASQLNPGQSLNLTGYISGVIEDDGICKLTLSKLGSSDIVKTANGFADVNKTDCPSFTIDFSEFGQSGDWQAKLSYSSSSASGSVSKTVTIK